MTLIIKNVNKKCMVFLLWATYVEQCMCFWIDNNNNKQFIDRRESIQFLIDFHIIFKPWMCFVWVTVFFASNLHSHESAVHSARSNQLH